MFSKKSAPERSSMATPRPASGSTFSVLGADTTIEGNIDASADLHIDGKIDGDISCAALVQGETSVIVGHVRAENARLAGSVKGSITARELVILKTARIEGDVRYDALTIEQGAQVDGKLSPRGATLAEALQPESGDTHLILQNVAS